LVSRSEDAQNAAAPLTILAVAGFFISFRVLDAPEGMLAVIAAMIPFTAPFVVPVRLALDAIPLWQVILSMAVMAASIVVLIRLAARVYAGGLLRFGARVKIREAWRGAG
jgi:ABC-2 type transport system permease protein